MTIVPQYRVKGDYWSFSVQFLDPASGLPIPLTSGLVPGGELFQAYSAVPALDLTVTNGGVSITDGPNGRVVFVVSGDVTQGAIPQQASNPSYLPQTYPTRLQCFLTDSRGRQTYTIVGIVPIDPKTMDLSTIPPATTIVAYAGATGAQGVPGPTGPSAYQVAVANGFTGTVQQWLASLTTSGGAGVLRFQVTAASSYTASHAFTYAPRVWIVDPSGAEVETDIIFAPGQVTAVFPVPFTGVLYLG